MQPKTQDYGAVKTTEYNTKKKRTKHNKNDFYYTNKSLEKKFMDGREGGFDIFEEQNQRIKV